jgi:hypothetical protein
MPARPVRNAAKGMFSTSAADCHRVKALQGQSIIVYYFSADYRFGRDRESVDVGMS